MSAYLALNGGNVMPLFFREVFDSQKSNALEWVITVLISFKCELMTLNMSGKGGDLFAVLSFF